MKNFLINFRHDLPASIVVFFVALPLCLGIALASGAPLFSGIIAGVVGGIVVGALSGSQLGVSGPAAGLAVIVYGYIATLGSYESFLVAVCIAGILQIIMGYCRLGSVAYYFPSSVIKGMLFGIGLMIIIKQIPHAVGYDSSISADFEEFIDQSALIILQNTFSNITPIAIIISAISLTLLIIWDNFLSKKSKIFNFIQGPLVVVTLGIVASNFVDLADHQIVQIPVANNVPEFFGNFMLPNFEELRNPQIYSMALILAIVASIETLLCVEATDKLDNLKRITPANRELKAQGFGNLISGLIGGLPLTQVIVRSSANISFGAKSKNSAIFHGILLMICAILIPNILNMIPYASLACILLVVGFKLSHPKLLIKIFKQGFEQFIPFLATIIGMLTFDLLKGVIIGMSVAIVFILINNFRNAFENVIDKHQKNSHTITLAQEVSFLNKGKILQLLKSIPDGSEVLIDGTQSKVIDFDVYEILRDFQVNAKSKNIKLTLKGITINKI
ncbi:MAG: SulP family inorganic anion transporter [Proteobacteria bacterium]|nr:SulP family inorganic anion transporter [Pseudomonadota bacterium]NCA27868.1 SulP family inorganic anion transporter [Pseudomonadota bacterium]